MSILQQGDVRLVPVSQVPASAVPKTKELHVVQEGEHTGHAHRLVGGRWAQVSTESGERYLRVVEPTTITHDTHAPIDVPAGDYRIDIVREYDYDTEESRRVVD